MILEGGLEPEGSRAAFCLRIEVMCVKATLVAFIIGIILGYIAGLYVPIPGI
jgi:ABC-type dipeptide/oligopeptide/nickel transport system permease subunit